MVVAQGSGHDLNLDFFAEKPFNTFVDFVHQLSSESKYLVPLPVYGSLFLTT
jgi:hypothetical protein